MWCDYKVFNCINRLVNYDNWLNRTCLPDNDLEPFRQVNEEKMYVVTLDWRKRLCSQGNIVWGTLLWRAYIIYKIAYLFGTEQSEYITV